MSLALQTAIEVLSEVTTVEEWNDMRESVKHFLSTSELATIDSGLIVKVLGMD